jgi:2-polyprenyl-3-methyl-5-hydroxy-6-metoxy-1,4-benzoquinol methylase
MSIMSTQIEWYESFFSKYWLDLQRQRKTIEQTCTDVDFIQKLLQVNPHAKVLDVPCGNGTHSLELASRGYQVTGVDLSLSLLENAQHEAIERKLKISWEGRDMRDLPWSEEFDGTFCFGGSFGYFDENGNIEFLKAVSRALRPGAKFVIETEITETLLPKFTERDWRQLKNKLVVQERSYDHENSRLETKLIFICDGKMEEILMSMRIYTYHELCNLLEESGFTNIEGYDFIKQQPFKYGATRLCLVATKKFQTI